MDPVCGQDDDERDDEADHGDGLDDCHENEDRFAHISVMLLEANDDDEGDNDNAQDGVEPLSAAGSADCVKGV